MKIAKLGLLLTVFGLASTTANAEDCSWSFSKNTVSGTNVATTYLCKAGANTAATKKVTTRVKGGSFCSISVKTGYKNTKTCESPNILKGAPGYGEPGWVIARFSNSAEIGGHMNRARTICRSKSGRIEVSGGYYLAICN